MARIIFPEAGQEPLILFSGIPVTGKKSDSWYVPIYDNIYFVVKPQGNTTTAICTPEISQDKIDWVPLFDQTQSISPDNPIGGFNLNQIPFHHVRLSFDNVIDGGDAFTVKASAKGFS